MLNCKQLAAALIQLKVCLFQVCVHTNLLLTKRANLRWYVCVCEEDRVLSNWTGPSCHIPKTGSCHVQTLHSTSRPESVAVRWAPILMGSPSRGDDCLRLSLCPAVA